MTANLGIIHEARKFLARCERDVADARLLMRQRPGNDAARRDYLEALEIRKLAKKTLADLEKEYTDANQMRLF